MSHNAKLNAARVRTKAHSMMRPIVQGTAKTTPSPALRPVDMKEAGKKS